MATSNPNLEFYKIRVFLYKYTPVFTALPTPPNVEGLLARADRYSIELDEAKYYRKFDITDYVSSYSFDQQINENTFNWSITLNDALIKFPELNKSLKVSGPDLDTTTLRNLASYEAQAKNLMDTTSILNAKLQRGTTQDALVTKTSTTTTTGLYLSDLIQSYDFVSLFVYKNATPLEDLRGEIVNVQLTPTLSVKQFNLNQGSSTLVSTSANPTTRIKYNYLRDENILLSPITVNGVTTTLFSNEFNGFVMRKTYTRQIGGVDTVTISGNGVTRLFGATRKLIKSSILQDTIYTLAEVVNPEQISAFQNTYVGKRVEEIFVDLFNLVYRLKFDGEVQEILINEKGGSVIQLPGDNSTTNVVRKQYFQPGEENFFDLSSLILGNLFQTNIFTIPPFLLAVVFKNRGFNYRTVKDGQVTSIGLAALQAKTSINLSQQNKNVINQTGIDKFLDTNKSLQILPSSNLKSPVNFDKSLNSLRPYFYVLEEILHIFNPGLKTPFEVIDEIKSKTLLEFFENPDGTISIRPPKYNVSDNNTIRSTDLDILSTSYNDSIEGLVSRHKVGYGIDIIKKIGLLQEYAFTNGKLLIQYGFLEAAVDDNPNVKNDKSDNDSVEKLKTPKMFKYAEYFLRLHNASLKTATITAGYDPKIVVGNTYYDDVNKKFGYIVGVSKSLSVGGPAPAQVTFQLSFVRDAFIDGTDAINTETLSTLLDISNAGGTDVTISEDVTVQ